MSALTLRFQLPPALTDPHSNPSVKFAGFDRRQQQVRQGEMPLLALLASAPGARFEAVLHPEDSRTAWVQLPPVAAKRMQEAVLGALEPMLLDPLEELVVAHGPRSETGRVMVAWASRARLRQLLACYAEAGLTLQALYPAPLNVPRPATGLAIDRRDDTLLLRDAEGQGHELVLDPLSKQAGLDVLESLQAWPVFRDAPQLHLYPAVTEWPWEQSGKPVQRYTADQAWCPNPGLSLAVADILPQQGLSSLAKKNLVWFGAALLIAIVGLNLYARQLNQEVQTLHQRMTQRVRQTFPQLPIVVDPLKQAQQQHAALLGQTGQSSETDFIPLSLAAAELLPELNNQVRRLTFKNGELTLELAPSAASTLGGNRAEGATPPVALSEAQQRKADALNLQIEVDGSTWRIRPTSAAASTLSNR